MKSEVNSKLILEYRKANRLTIKEFCKKCNISAPTYYKLLKYGNDYQITTLFNIARAMNVSISELFN